MHFLIGLAFNNEISCKTISFLLGALTTGSIAYLCLHCFKNKKIIIPSILVFYTFTPIIANMSNCDVDMPQALWTILALFVLEKYLAEKKMSYLVISALLAGMAVQTKIFGVFAIPLLIVRLIIGREGPFLSTLHLKEFVTVLSIPFIMGLPWYLKSYLYNQTVLAISHSSIEGQGLAAPMGINGLYVFWYWVTNVFVRIPAAPWTFSIFPGQHQGNTFGPLFLIVLPFLMFVKVPLKVKYLMLMMLAFVAQILFMEIWFIQGGSSIRYSMFILITGAPLIIWIVSNLSDLPKTRKVLQGMIISMICLGGSPGVNTLSFRT